MTGLFCGERGLGPDRTEIRLAGEGEKQKGGDQPGKKDNNANQNCQSAPQTVSTSMGWVTSSRSGPAQASRTCASQNDAVSSAASWLRSRQDPIWKGKKDDATIHTGRDRRNVVVRLTT